MDRWLSAARIYKSRTQATAACAEGDVRVNGAPAKPSYALKVGDEIAAEAPRGAVVLDVAALCDKRLSPALARELYVDRSPPPPPKGEVFPLRDRGAGRPTKVERRAVERFRGR